MPRRNVRLRSGVTAVSSIRSNVMRSYQSSSALYRAYSCMRIWYCVTRDSIRRSPVRRLKRICRAATMKLAASRLRSHSQGPSATSSKSFRSNTSWRSGVANPPNAIRCASPHMGMTKPVFDILLRSFACRIALPLKNENGDCIIRTYLSGISRSMRPRLFCSSSSIGSRSIVPILACAERAIFSRYALPAAIRDAVLFSVVIRRSLMSCHRRATDTQRGARSVCLRQESPAGRPLASMSFHRRLPEVSEAL